MPKLTKTLIDGAAAGTADTWLWDTEVKGFGVRIQPSGRKTYVIRYRTEDAVQRKHTLARCSDMPPDRARELARKAFIAVAEGRDPVADRADARQATSMAELFERYMREHAQPFKKPASARQDATNWRLHIGHRIGTKKVKTVAKEDILVVTGAMAKIPAVGNQCLALLSKMMNLAETWGYRPQNSNPCKGVKKYRIKEREAILSPAQIGDLNRTMDEMLVERQIVKPMADLIRLLMLTGCRLNEIMSARREWVDPDRCLLLLPDSKVGQRRIPLSPAAMEIVAGIPTSNLWLIPGRTHGKHLAVPHIAWRRIKARAGLPKEVRIHDLRHTAGSLAHAAGLSQKQIAMMLGHKQLSTTERYLHGLHGDGARVMDTLASVVTKGWGSAA